MKKAILLVTGLWALVILASFLLAGCGKRNSTETRTTNTTITHGSGTTPACSNGQCPAKTAPTTTPAAGMK